MADLDFDLSAEREAGGTRLRLRGELDLATAARLEHALADAEGDVLLDLRGLTFMDSTGLRVLLEAAERSGPGLKVLPPESGDARTTIDESGIGPLLPLVREGAEGGP